MDQDPISSFGQSGAEGATEDSLTTPKASMVMQEEKDEENLIDNGLNCECGISVKQVLLCYESIPYVSNYRSKTNAAFAKEVADDGIMFGLLTSDHNMSLTLP